MHEIWKCILARLVELKIMRDPDHDSFYSDESSEEGTKDYDFIRHANKRQGILFKPSKKLKETDKCLADMMPQKDYTLMNQMMMRVADHEKLTLQLYENDIIGFITQTSQMNKS